MRRYALFGIIQSIVLVGGMFLPFPAMASIQHPQVREQYLSHFNAGEDAFNRCDYVTAVSQFQQALNLFPAQLRPRFRLGQAFFKLQRYPEGINVMQTVLQAHPNNIAARIMLAQGLIAVSQGEMARPHLEWVLQVQPEHAEARQLIASLAYSAPTSPAVLSAPGPQSANREGFGSQGAEQIPAGFQPLPVRPAPEGEIDLALSAAPAPVAAPDGNTQTTRSVPRPKQATRALPPDIKPAPTWQVAEFLRRAKGSYGVDLAFSKYCLEKDDLVTAQQHLDAAEKVAARSRETRKFLEVQVHKSLLFLYQGDLRRFGEQLMRLQSLLSKETYASFLEIYNQGNQATSSLDLSKLIGGVAMGAEHYAVAARILADVWLARPDDTLSGHMLAEAQLNSDDFAGAERTLLLLAQTAPKDPEVAINLGRFYLTARFQPQMARRYVNWAASLSPQDARIPLLQALLDYAEGKIQVGLARLRKSQEAVSDPEFQALCEKIIGDGEKIVNGQGAKNTDFRQVLALPGSPHATPDTTLLRGESYLKRGSYFLALKEYMKAKDLAEIGRTYLGISSYLWNLGERDASVTAASFGVKALADVLERSERSRGKTEDGDPLAARAHLYLSLYHLEREHAEKAKQHAQQGLRLQPSAETRRRLSAVLSVSAKPAEQLPSAAGSGRGS